MSNNAARYDLYRNDSVTDYETAFFVLPYGATPTHPLHVCWGVDVTLKQAVRMSGRTADQLLRAPAPADRVRVRGFTRNQTEIISDELNFMEGVVGEVVVGATFVEGERGTLRDLAERLQHCYDDVDCDPDAYIDHLGELTPAQWNMAYKAKLRTYDSAIRRLQEGTN